MSKPSFRYDPDDGVDPLFDEKNPYSDVEADAELPLQPLWENIALVFEKLPNYLSAPIAFLIFFFVALPILTFMSWLYDMESAIEECIAEVIVALNDDMPELPNESGDSE